MTQVSRLDYYQELDLDKIRNMSYVNILKVKDDHATWMKGLEFYKEELQLMQKRLEETAVKNTAEDSRKGVEHFQNQFLIQEKNISFLKHDIRSYTINLATDAKMHYGQVDEVFIEKSNLLHEKYEQIEHIMKDLRKEFNEFLVKWM